MGQGGLGLRVLGRAGLGGCCEAGWKPAVASESGLNTRLMRAACFGESGKSAVCDCCGLAMGDLMRAC